MNTPKNDVVYLREGIYEWPLQLAESLLANPVSWGPPTYVLGFGYIEEEKNAPDQFDNFYQLATCVNGYERHPDNYSKFVDSISDEVKAGHSLEKFSTQDLLDAVFIVCRQERFCDGLIRSYEPALRAMVQEVVRRVHSDTPPIFLASKEPGKRA
ncbi:MAG TPA: hypothetical protein VFA41_23545 [Ktedonobacteraceae bacterium]|jgi:hypothetical protein|nr:hypothetical protein [Ktedonobacteraceae bacterium]